MSSTPVQVPHPWSKDALFNKSQQYVEQMHTYATDDWRFVLWSTFALELLARAALANVSPTLLADPRDWKNTLYALEIEPRATKFVPRSIDVSTVLDRLEKILPDFRQELSGFALLHMSRRNEELHSGGNPMLVRASSWLPLYYRTCEVLLASINESFEAYFGKDTAEAAKKMIAAWFDESAKAVGKAVHDSKVAWEAKGPEEREQLAAQASVWATKQVGHRVKCPACSSDAIIYGAAIAAPVKTLDGDEITEVQQYLPAKFECIACGLKISGLPQLAACGLGDPYTATFTYDASEYYAPEDSPEDMYPEYEPDYNEPF